MWLRQGAGSQSPTSGANSDKKPLSTKKQRTVLVGQAADSSTGERETALSGKGRGEVELR